MFWGKQYSALCINVKYINLYISFESLYNWLRDCAKDGRASLEFYVHLDMSQIGIVCGNFEVFILHHFKVFFASLFSLSLAERSKIAITF